MRILHVITTINRGGAENQLLLLVKEQLKVGHTVSVFPLKGNLELKKQFEIYGAKVEYSFTNNSVLRQILALRSSSKNFDIVHAHLPRAEIVSFLGAHGKFLISRHNCEPFFPAHPGLISKLLSRLIELRSERVIAISETVKSYLVSNKEVKEKKISVVRYGFDRTIQYVDKPQPIELQGEIIIGTISRLVIQKDIGTLLRAFQDITIDFPQARLVIAGEGPLQEELNGLADHLKISENIDWIGKIEDPLNLIAQFDIFVMTSLYEGFGLVVLEAISQEVPVIASGNETFKEIFGAHQEYLFPVGNHESLALKIRKYLNKDECSRLAEIQQSILEHYSPARMIAGMEKVYTAVET